jgi:DNA-directed RNA polymerase specialized sigma24 family protein
MLNRETRIQEGWRLMGQSELPPSVLFGETELDWWPYRSKTMALLRRYARASVEVGRLPSLLGRELFRARLSSRTKATFEDTVVFVTDIERTLDGLDGLGKKLVAMYALEEYTISEISRLLSCSEKTAERLLHDTIDKLSKMLVNRKLLSKLPDVKTTKEGVAGIV